ncbi:hypothetical protein ACEZDB_02975 [Streptacidiphilus sp. N1-3]|uniref:Uncharacterized protein n=1 Tax=Streptacidiphilus alkalitolerans TaxID=3342712 RepID=A0ABV6WUL6_9ACTN
MERTIVGSVGTVKLGRLAPDTRFLLWSTEKTVQLLSHAFDLYKKRCTAP